MKKCGKFLKKCVWLEKNLLQMVDDGSFVKSDVLVTPEFKLCSTPSHDNIYYTVHENIPSKLFRNNKRIKTNVNIKKLVGKIATMVKDYVLLGMQKVLDILRKLRGYLTFKK